MRHEHREGERNASLQHSLNQCSSTLCSFTLLSRILRHKHRHTYSAHYQRCMCVCALCILRLCEPFWDRRISLALSLSSFPSLTLSPCVTLTVTVLWLQMNHLLSVSGTSLEASSRGSDSGSDSDNRLAAPHQSQSEIGLLRLLARPWQQTWQP